MNFKEAYKKVADGTASLEESAFVAQEIVKAQNIRNILDNDEPMRAELELVDNETVARARKNFNLKNTIKIIVISLLVILLVSGGIITYVIMTAKTSADRTATLDRDQAIEIARKVVQEQDTQIDANKLIVKDVDKHLNLSEGLQRAKRIYEIEFDQGVVEYEVRVNATTGDAVITDIDY